VNLSDKELTALMDGLAPRARLMGVDLGTKTIGLALSDVEKRIATPLETLRRVKFTPDAARIKALAEQHDVGALVIGLPLNMDGSEGPRSQSTRSFARLLGPIVGRPILFWDERLSTVAVTRTLLEADASRAKRADAVDKMAAAYILQGALDRYARILADRQRVADALSDPASEDLDIERPPTGSALDV
jgi:putative Holliday junction resolvase